jgi:NAD(P)-dependent dehydrogenase (short-subunit alcohol dehydrogenase family)/acyl carrier protein
MGAGIEDVVAIRALNTGIVPPIANYKVPDPELSGINLSKGGKYDLKYALRLSAGFGSQNAMTLVERTFKKGENRLENEQINLNWLKQISNQPSPELEVVCNTLRVKDTGTAKGGKPPVIVDAPQAFVKSQENSKTVLRSKTKAVVETAKPEPEKPKHRPCVKYQSSLNEKEIKVEILKMISKKTGYPEDMLDIDLDMEADLGIDTVKQAELFASIREHYQIPQKEGLQLKDYPTIRHCIRFVTDELGETAAENKVQESSAEPVKPDIEPASAAEPEKPVAKPSSENEEIKSTILKMISEKTGYPEDMLDIDLDMEADLGIDTVKQAELFASIREHYQIPQKEGLQLKDYPTIRHCIRFVTDELEKKQPLQKDAKEKTKSHETKEKANINQKNLRTVPSLVEVPLTTKENRKLSETRPVIIFSDDAGLTKAYQSEFKKLNVPVHVFTSTKVKSRNASTVNFKDVLEVQKILKEFASENPKISGIVYLLGAVSRKLDTGVSAHDDLTRYALPLFIACKVFESDLKDRENCDTFIAVNITLDGRFGLKTKKGFDPLYGAVSGMTHCLRKDMYELTKTLTKLIDFDPLEKQQDIARKTIEEILHGDNRLTLCFDKDRRMTYHTFPIELNKSQVNYKLEGRTVMVTGGGRGLGALFAKTIAKKYSTSLILLDIIEIDANTPRHAEMTAEQFKEFEKNLWNEMKSDKTQKATPLMLKNQITRIKDAITLYNDIEEIKKLGVKVEYHFCDITDKRKFAELLEKIKNKHGQIDGVVHFAGLERSKLVNEKTLDEFYKVFDVKADSAMDMVNFALVKESGFWIFISSIAGKFGNIGQSDYAAASDYISKLAISLNNTGIRSIAFDMSAYGELGMAIRPGVMAFLKSQGLDFVNPSSGMNVIIDELVHGKESEIILTSTLGKLDWDGQLRPAGENSFSPDSGGSGQSEKDYHFIEKTEKLEKEKKLLARKVFSIEKDPYLTDHAIENKPYVPGVMGIETFMESGCLLFGKRVNSVKNVRFNLPIKLLRNKPVEILIKSDGNKIELESDFIGPKGVKLKTRTHFTCQTIKEISKLDWDCKQPDLLGFKSYTISKEQIYKDFFHGPSFQVLDGICKVDKNEVFAVYKKPDAPLWKNTAHRKLIAHPMIIEAAFQTCGYRDLRLVKRVTLPDRVAKVAVSPDEDAPQKLYVWAKFKKTEENKSVYDAYVFDDGRKLWVILKDYYMIG